MSLSGPSIRKSKPIINHGTSGVVVSTSSNGSITGSTSLIGSSSRSDSGNSNTSTSTFTLMGPGELCYTGDEGYNEVSSSTSTLTTNSTTTSSSTPTTTSSSVTRVKRVGSNENDDSGPPVKRRRGEDRNGKGLRHFSMKVCQKVKDKGTTTYNEVADELVAEFSSESTGRHHGGGSVDESNDGHGNDNEVFDQKNIRRRVYDAFNVLMAMNIISKEKKVIKWLGLPSGTNNNHPLSVNSTGPGSFCHDNNNHSNRFNNNNTTPSTNNNTNPTTTNIINNSSNINTTSSSSTINVNNNNSNNNATIELEKERQSRLERLSAKKERLRELMLQNIAVKSLIERNKRGPLVSSNAKINLPFIIVNTDRSTVIDCSINSEKTEYAFSFGNTFEIHDDAEILKRLGLTYGLQRHDLVQIDRTIYDKARSLLPIEVRPSLDELIEERGAVIRS